MMNLNYGAFKALTKEFKDKKENSAYTWDNNYTFMVSVWYRPDLALLGTKYSSITIHVLGKNVNTSFNVRTYEDVKYYRKWLKDFLK